MKYIYFQKANKNKYWKNISKKDWQNYQWQQKNRITDPNQLKLILPFSEQEFMNISDSLVKLRMAITPYYLSQIDPKDEFCPIKLQAIPSILETHISKNDFLDPLNEEGDCPVPGLEGVLTHRYPDRLVVYVTFQCAMYCRHCTRRRRAGEIDFPTPWKKILKAAEYIKKTETVRDILISGGDPLTLSTPYLEKILKLFRSIKHIEIN